MSAVTQRLVVRRLVVCIVCLAVFFALGACNTLMPYRNASFNEPLRLAAPALVAPAAPRNTFDVDGQRGNRKMLMFLALSGGGSRAAYFSAATMLALQERLPVDLLAEVDVISSVSGGSVAAAYYVASRDTRIADDGLIKRLGLLTASNPPKLSQLVVDAQGKLGCGSALSPQDRTLLAQTLGPGGTGEVDIESLAQLCESGSFPAWTRTEVLDRMKANHLRDWMVRWFYPSNILRYWTSSFDRSDIMAQTLANNLYTRRGLFGGELAMNDLNPTRPYLIINATDATNQQRDNGELDEFPFGSVFTFTREDFADRLNSDARSYPLARSVMGSSAFPLVFASMTLRDFRPMATPPCPPGTAERPCHDERYLHIFDGGNSDNLGLRSVKRALLQLQVEGRLQDYDRIVVLLVDSFTTPRGAARDDPDPRSLISLLVDTNMSDAVDSLLQTNRDRLLGEFDTAQLSWSRDCGGDGLRQLPTALCAALARGSPAHGSVDISSGSLNLADRLVFYHFGFEDVTRFAPGLDGQALKRSLDSIPTSFRLDREAAVQIERAVDLVISPRNSCMQALGTLATLPGSASAEQLAAARRACKMSEAGRRVVHAPVPTQ